MSAALLTSIDESLGPDKWSVSNALSFLKKTCVHDVVFKKHQVSNNQVCVGNNFVYDNQVVQQDTFETNHIRISSGPNPVAFDELSHTVRHCAEETRKWIRMWNPLNFKTIDEQIKSLDGMPSGTKRMFELTKKADNMEENYCLDYEVEKKNPCSYPPKQLQWIEKTWLEKSKLDLYEHLSQLKQTPGRTFEDGPWTVSFYCCKPSDEMKVDINRLGFEIIDYVPKFEFKPDCLVVGPFPRQQQPVMAKSMFCLTVANQPVDRMVSVRSDGPFKVGTFIASKNTYYECNVIDPALYCVKYDQQLKQMQKSICSDVEWFHRPYFANEPTWIPWENKKYGLKAARTRNPFSSAFWIARSMPPIEVPYGVYDHRGVPENAPHSQPQYVCTVMPYPDAVHFEARAGDTPVRFRLTSDLHHVTLRLSIGVQSVVPRGKWVPPGLAYEGFGICRYGLITNPLIYTSTNGCSEANYCYYPTFFLSLVRAVGGFRFEPWKDGLKVNEWNICPRVSNLVPMTELKGKIYLFSPYILASGEVSRCSFVSVPSLTREMYGGVGPGDQRIVGPDRYDDFCRTYDIISLNYPPQPKMRDPPRIDPENLPDVYMAHERPPREPRAV